LEISFQRKVFRRNPGNGFDRDVKRIFGIDARGEAEFRGREITLTIAEEHETRVVVNRDVPANWIVPALLKRAKAVPQESKIIRHWRGSRAGFTRFE
jgi:hypothetical protein